MQPSSLLEEEEFQRILDAGGAELELKLTAEQYAVLRARGPTLLSGSAGSGKTTIAVHRLAEAATAPGAPRCCFSPTAVGSSSTRRGSTATSCSRGAWTPPRTHRSSRPSKTSTRRWSRRRWKVLGDDDRALAADLKSVEVGRPRPGAVARAYLRHRRYAEAIECFEKEGDQTGVRTARAQQAERSRRWEAAAEEWRLAGKPKKAHACLARAARSRGDLAEAARLFRAAGEEKLPKKAERDAGTARRLAVQARFAFATEAGAARPDASLPANDGTGLPA